MARINQSEPSLSGCDDAFGISGPSERLRFAPVLDEFALRVSDVVALGTPLGRGAKVREIRNLHAKMYLFGETRTIVTSANLTDAGFDRNAELGIVTNDPAAVASCMDYFESLWNRGRILRPAEATDWAATLPAYLASGGRRRASPSLGDIGADIGLPQPPRISLAAPFYEGEQAFVKFLGTTTTACARPGQYSRNSNGPGATGQSPTRTADGRGSSETAMSSSLRVSPMNPTRVFSVEQTPRYC